jgi:hypothetical protein
LIISGDLMEAEEQAQLEAWLTGLSDADLAALASDKAIWSSRAMVPPDAPCMVPQRKLMALVQAEIDRRWGNKLALFPCCYSWALWPLPSLPPSEL